MSRELDVRARRAAANLNTAMERAELTALPPGTTGPRRVFFGALRPALIVGLLVIGSAVGLGVVMDSSPAPLPPDSTTTTSTTVTSVSTTLPPTTTTAPVPTTSVYVVPAPTTTTTTVAVDSVPPHLEVTSPEDGAELKEKTVTFEGVTEAGARVFAGKYEADVDVEGNWRIVLILNEGSNVARFTARDAAGNESEAALTVYYVVEKPTTTTTTVAEKELAEFSAFSQFGSCSETPPYDVYYGTGEPGSTVEIASEYGSGSVVVGESGNWEKKVIFEEAPADKPFLVHVSDEFGREAVFEFVYLP